MGEREDRLWSVALSDASIPAEISVGLMLFDDVPRDPRVMPWGSHVEPEADAWDILGHLYHFLPTHQAQAASDAGRHQVLVHTGVEDPVLLALMRHELEHVRQNLRSPWITRVSSALNRTFQIVLEEVEGAHRGIYPWLPAEQDASAASTALVAKQFDARVIVKCAQVHDTLLGTLEASGPPDSLGIGALALGSLFPEDFDQAVNEVFETSLPPQQAARHLSEGLLGPDGPDLYVACMMDPAVRAVHDPLVASMVMSWALRRGSVWARWAPVRRLFGQVRRRSEVLWDSPETRAATIARIS